MADEKKQTGRLKEKRLVDRTTGSRERRNYIRTDTTIPMILRIEDSGATKELQATTGNISATGMMIEASGEIALGAEIKLELRPPESLNPIHCAGKVVWIAPVTDDKKYHYGIEFIKIEEDNKNTFLKFLCDVIYRSSNNI